MGSEMCIRDSRQLVRVNAVITAGANTRTSISRLVPDRTLSESDIDNFQAYFFFASPSALPVLAFLPLSSA